MDRATEAERLRVAAAVVRGRIADACARAGRDPAEVTLVAVSKTVEPDRVRLAIEAGLTTLGENRVQEAATKIPVADGATWHLVGPLQSNKARRALELFDVIETVDSLGLARRLDGLVAEIRPGSPAAVLLQVNVDDDPAKAGFRAADLERDLGVLLDLAGLDVLGLMTVGRLVGRAGEARPTFEALRRLSERARAGHPRLGAALSMGMTDDYETAIEEGATMVRVGRALFGERQSVG